MFRSLALAAVLLAAACVEFPEPNPTPLGEGASARSAAPAAVAAMPAGTIHKIQRGETVFGLAERFGVPVRSLIDANRLTPPYALVPGWTLFVPKPREHVVAKGDTVYGISRRYGVDMSTLTRLNGIDPPYTIKVGQSLRIPSPVETGEPSVAVAAAAPAELPALAPAAGPTLSPVPAASSAAGRVGVEAESLPPSGSSPAAAPAAAPAAPVLAPIPAPVPAAVPAAKPATSVANAVPEPAPRSSNKFLWPVNGKIVSSFGPKQGGLHNDGVNIAAPKGTPVRAAENGIVAYAGNELRGFGNLLLIKHADGWTSAYAHNDQLLVHRGDRVTRGQVIAKVGSTGSVSSPQLHFELREGARAVDPLRLLAGSG